MQEWVILTALNLLVKARDHSARNFGGELPGLPRIQPLVTISFVTEAFRTSVFK
jgi:hypothetical protein